MAGPIYCFKSDFYDSDRLRRDYSVFRTRTVSDETDGIVAIVAGKQGNGDGSAWLVDNPSESLNGRWGGNGLQTRPLCPQTIDYILQTGVFAYASQQHRDDIIAALNALGHTVKDIVPKDCEKREIRIGGGGCAVG